MAASDPCMPVYATMHDMRMLNPNDAQALRREMIASSDASVRRFLNMHNNTFWTQIATDLSTNSTANASTDTCIDTLPESESVIAFIDAYMHRRSLEMARLAVMPASEACSSIMDDPLVDAERALEHAVFCLVVRMLSPPDTPNNHPPANGSPPNTEINCQDNNNNNNLDPYPNKAWINACTMNKLFTCARVCDIARCFGKHNQPVLRPLVSHLLSDASLSIVDELRRAFGIVMDAVHALQRKRLKSGASDGGAASVNAKGKGKAKAVDAGAHNQYTEANIDASAPPKYDNSTDASTHAVNALDTSASKELVFLMDTVDTLVSVIDVSGNHRLIAYILQHPRLASSLCGIYDIATMHHQRTASTPTRRGAIDPLAIFEDTDSETNIIARQCRKLKRSVTSLVSTLITHGFVQPATQNAQTNAPFDPIISEMCDFVYAILELTEMGNAPTFMIDAPLLLDFEVEYGLSASLRDLSCICTQSTSNSDTPASLPLQTGDSQFDTTRIDYLVGSIEHLVMFSGNGNTRQTIAASIARSNQRTSSSQQPQSQNTPASAQETNANNAANDINMNRTLNVSLVHDLFPELGDGFIEACLVALNDDYEAVIMCILENNLPECVKNLDRLLPRIVAQPPVLPKRPDAVHTNSPAAVGNDQDANPSRNQISPPAYPTEHPYPHEYTAIQDHMPVMDDLLTSRRNIFDGDAFDVFSGAKLDTDWVTRGKAEKSALKESDRREFVDQVKSSILDMEYEAYDKYDDEHDDTYDSMDVTFSGTAGVHADDGESGPSTVMQQKRAAPVQQYDPTTMHERALASLYETDKTFFEPSQRKSKARIQFCQSTGLSNEQIEGWFKMLQRNPSRGVVLEQYEWRGNRHAMELAAAETGGVKINASQPNATQNGVGRGNDDARGDRGRGRGRSRGRGSFKDAHARKMARGMNRPDF